MCANVWRRISCQKTFVPLFYEFFSAKDCLVLVHLQACAHAHRLNKRLKDVIFVLLYHVPQIVWKSWLAPSWPSHECALTYFYLLSKPVSYCISLCFDLRICSPVQLVISHGRLSDKALAPTTKSIYGPLENWTKVSVALTFYQSQIDLGNTVNAKENEREEIMLHTTVPRAKWRSTRDFQWNSAMKPNKELHTHILMNLLFASSKLKCYLPTKVEGT